ncbi:MAG: hypothetical protein JWM53_1602 [bacterium]|nr:hypothetical protein [bacterium]
MKTITIGRSLVSVEHIALVEHFDRTANPRLQSDKRFKAGWCWSTARAC